MCNGNWLRGYRMELAKKSDTEILAIANPIMDNLMDASTAIDHERHIVDFTERMKAIVTKEYLEKVCRQYQREKGFFGAREAVAVLRRPQSVAIIWKQRFTKQEGEYVAEMVLVEKDSCYLVDHVMVF
jgi:2C-methyl-D-erythritol 2,4-cyclodiphosphate synthase